MMKKKRSICVGRRDHVTLSKKTHVSTGDAKIVGKQKQTFHGRPLPEHLIPFNSNEGRDIFIQTLGEGGLRGYWALAEQSLTQTEPATCGLASLAMVMNALKVDPKTVWKGVWRWWDESTMRSLSSTCECVEYDKALEEGVTMSQLVSFAQCSGIDAKGYYAGEEGSRDDIETSGIESFRDVLRRTQMESTKDQSNDLVIASWSRPALGQTGDGHFSPLSAYCPTRDVVLVMDVARFKYPMYFVSVETLYEAMTHVDEATGKPRGYVVVSGDQRGLEKKTGPCSPNRISLDIPMRQSANV